MRFLNWVLALANVEACGVAVHLELTERILPLLPPRIAEHYDYVRSGAFYPDAFYNCMGQYDVAEDAHWPPFIAKGVELVRKRRLQGYDTARLEAFLLGILTHQVSDVSWHSLGLFEGLLRSMAEMEFDGDYDKAHSVLDIGGDMITLSRRVLRETKSTKWEYSVDDILALLEVNGYTDIPPNSIRYCMARGHAAYSAELRVAPIGFRRFARRSPMMFDQLESYFIGGLTDMHEQIEECFPQLIDWFTNGITGSPWKICQVFAGTELDRSHPPGIPFDPDKLASFFEEDDPAELEDTERSRQAERPMPPEEFEVMNTATIPAPGTDENLPSVVARRKHINLRRRNAHSINIDRFLNVLGDIVQQGRDKMRPHCHGKQISSQFVKPPPLPSGNSKHNIAEISQSSFGTSLLFWKDMLVVGAPSECRVYLYAKGNGEFSKLVNVLKSKGKPKEKGHFAARFGAALAIWHEFLVVSSPGRNELDFYDVRGRWRGGVKFSGTVLDYGYRGIKLIGESLAADPLSGTLYVGAPYVDLIDDTLHIQSRSAADTDVTDADDAAADAENPILDMIQENPEGQPEGQPEWEHHTFDQRSDQVGSVYALKSDVISSIVRAREYTELHPRDHVLYEGEHHYEQAGFSLTIAPQFVLVGSPGESVVRGYDRMTGKQLLTLTGESFHPTKPSGFGGNMIVGNSDYLVVGAPAGALADSNGEVSLNQPGVLSIYKNRRAHDIEGSQDFEWFGKTGVIVGSSVYVASPHAAGGHGALWRVDMSSAKVESMGSIKDAFGSGFGTAMATNGELIALGMPYFGARGGESRQGAVAIVDVRHKK